MLMDGLFDDDEVARRLDAPAQLAAMLQVEAALARAQGVLGIIPTDAATRIAAVAATLTPDPAALIAEAARAGIAAQPLIATLKKACGMDADWVHFGATSQDIQDSASILQTREVLSILQDRLTALHDILTRKAQAHADLAMPARTRFQIAAPTTLGAKIAVWRAPLPRHLDRLAELRPRLLNISLYGAAGTGAALAPQMPALRRAVAADLGLNAPDIPWHATRDAIAELAGWLSMVTGTLGKLGADLILLGQSEVAELRAGIGGGSSTMPQKSNPVAAEALVSLARLNAGAVGTIHQAMIHAQERDGTALALEWQTLPQMLIRTGAALRLAQDLAHSLTPNPQAIADSFARDRGAMLAEAAGFYLTRHIPRDKALRIVAQALARVAAEGDTTLAQALHDLQPGHDWAQILSPAANTGDATTQARNRSSWEERR